MKRKIRRTLGGLLVTVMVLAAPAFADDSVSFGGGVAQVRPGHNNMIRACDTQVDGHRVRAWFYHVLQYPGEPTLTPFAPSGGCTEWMGTSWGQALREFRVCVEAEGCSPWVRR